MDQCIFCQIRDGEISSKIVYEDAHVVAFHDINPKAEIHLLIIPRSHIASVEEMKEDDIPLMGHMIYAAKLLGDQFHLRGYQLKFHVGPDGGQEVPHVHLHFLGSLTAQHSLHGTHRIASATSDDIHKGGDHG